jgi:hypothetical protein
MTKYTGNHADSAMPMPILGWISKSFLAAGKMEEN